jgi:hypothetical protein
MRIATSVPRWFGGIAALLVVAVGFVALMSGRIGFGPPSPTESGGQPCSAPPTSGALLAIVDPTSTTGERVGVADKPGTSANAPWPNPGLGLGDSIEARTGNALSLRWSDGTTCLGPWKAYVLPYFTGPTAPGGSVAPLIAGSANPADPAATIAVPGQGDWILRVDVSAADRPNHWYWRVRVGLPGPSPSGSQVTPAVPCTAEDAAHAPDFILRTKDAKTYTASPYGSRWGGKPFDDGTWPPTKTIHLASGSGLEIDVQEDVCAIEWAILYGEPPRTDAPVGFMPEGDIVPPVTNRDPMFAQQDRFSLSAIPSGTWLIAGRFGFVNGEALVAWKISVP